MRVLLLVSFRAPFGGLHEHVAAQAHALQNAGDEPVVHCPEGPFAALLRAKGVRVLPDSNAGLDQEAARLVDEVGAVDLIHAHPFRSRMIGERIRERLAAPLVLTLHSQYLDGVDQKHSVFDLIFTVSQACRDHLLSHTDCPPEKVVVLHNGARLDAFRPGPAETPVAWRSDPALLRALEDREAPVVAVVSRLDADKAFLIDLLKDVWRQGSGGDLFWLIVGEGTERGALEAVAAETYQRFPRQTQHFIGWLREAELVSAYRYADVVVAPGRSAIEALACGKPVIALGSRGYVGPVPGRGTLKAFYSNFGGVERNEDGATIDVFSADLAAALIAARDPSLPEAVRSLVAAAYDQDAIDRMMLAAYRSLTMR